MESAVSIYNEYVRQWKDSGGQVIGTVCCHIPEEIIHAAGLLPVRIRATGCKNDCDGELWMSSFSCGFSRGCLQQMLDGNYDFMDGMIASDGCMMMQRVYDNWKVIGKEKTKYFQNINVPRLNNGLGVDYYAADLALMRDGLEEFTGRAITDDALNASIDLYNETRALIRSLYALRKDKSVAVTGAECLQWTLAAMSMPKERFNEQLRVFLDEVKHRAPITNCRARLMLIGSSLDDPEFLRIFEDHGGLIVTDCQCFGSRYLWEDVTRQPGDPPLTALARTYLGRPSCPRMTNMHEELCQLIIQSVKDYHVDGIVYVRMKNCSVWGGESLFFYDRLRELGIPVLTLQREEITTNAGQVVVRAEAFLEMIEGGIGE